MYTGFGAGHFMFTKFKALPHWEHWTYDTIVPTAAIDEILKILSKERMQYTKWSFTNLLLHFPKHLKMT